MPKKHDGRDEERLDQRGRRDPHDFVAELVQVAGKLGAEKFEAPEKNPEEHERQDGGENRNHKNNPLPDSTAGSRRRSDAECPWRAIRASRLARTSSPMVAHSR